MDFIYIKQISSNSEKSREGSRLARNLGSIFLLSQRLPNTCWILDCLLKYVLSSSLPVDKVEHLGASCELTIIIPYKCSFF